MSFIIFSTIIISTVSFIGYVIISRIEYHKLRSKIGLSGPKTHWFLGNTQQFVDRKNALGYDDSYEWLRQLHERYGDKYGVYFGKQLSILISSEEDIKEVFIKQFSNFSDRLVAPLSEEGKLMTSLLNASYSNGWKNTRSAISPIFTTQKMKAMHYTVSEKIDTFLGIIEGKSRKEELWDIYEDFQALTLDVIGKCAFAIDSDCQRNRSEMFYVQARNFIKNMDIKHSKIISLSYILPELTWFWRLLYRFTGLAAAEAPLVDGLSCVYERRRAGECSESVDLLKLLLDRENHKDHPMSKQEIIENCFAFLLAGYETTSTALTYCIYLLSKHPEVQKKLVEEIQETKIWQGLDYDSIHNLKYLDAVYKETLRVYPPVIHFVNRVCLQDTYIRDQFIPKGTCISVNPYTVHRNEENWPNASEFQPERFLNSEDKSSLKWIPFGVGPHICVGMRFAEMEFKTTIVKLLEKFEIMDSGEKMVPEGNGIIMRPKDGVRVKIVKREGL